MNARDRKLLAQGINPATGQALTAPVFAPAGPARLVSQPANATAAPWAQAAVTVPVPQAVAVAVPAAPRVWYDTGERGESKSGNATVILLSSMRNGGFFRCTFPADAVRAIAHGLVLGADGEPVKF
jgi:hypothetical protein